MKSIALTIAFTLAAGPSLALSCLPPSAVNSYNEAAASESQYIVVHGKLVFDETKLPEIDLQNQDQIPPHTDIRAQLSGKSLSHAGFDTDFDRAITLRAQCFGPWCGRAVSGGDYLSFLEKTDDGYLLTVTPCGGYDFIDPTDEMLHKVTQCFQGENCVP